MMREKENIRRYEPAGDGSEQERAGAQILQILGRRSYGLGNGGRKILRMGRAVN